MEHTQKSQEAQTLIVEYSNGYDNITRTLDGSRFNNLREIRSTLEAMRDADINPVVWVTVPADARVYRVHLAADDSTVWMENRACTEELRESMAEEAVTLDDDMARPYTQAEFVAAAVSARTYYGNPILLVESVPQTPGFVGKVFVTVQDGTATRRTYTTFGRNMATYVAPRAFGA